jgi:glycosyltransferase involved in cell wall biosynthesis
VNQDRPGLSGARNTGLRHARSDVVAFLDDDAVAEPGWLAALLRHYADPRVLGVGGLVLPEWQGPVPAWFPPEFGWVVGCSYTGQPTTTDAVRNPIGANMSFRRSVLDRVGGFSSALGRVGTEPRGCEETEISIRARQAFPGGVILHEPAAVVLHHVPASRGSWSYFVRRCWHEGLSKAEMSRLVDHGGGLTVERTYAMKVLPAGLRRDLGRAGRRLEVTSLMRGLATGAGLAVTTAGYLARRPPAPTRHHADTSAGSATPLGPAR